MAINAEESTVIPIQQGEHQSLQIIDAEESTVIPIQYAEHQPLQAIDAEESTVIPIQHAEHQPLQAIDADESTVIPIQHAEHQPLQAIHHKKVKTNIIYDKKKELHSNPIAKKRDAQKTIRKQRQPTIIELWTGKKSVAKSNVKSNVI
eukprot:883538_1